MIRSFSTLLLALLLCTPLAAQVNYKLLPDYDNVPPVDWRLGVKNGNAPIGVKSQESGVKGAKSHSFSAEAEEDELPDHWNNALFKHFPPYFYQSGRRACAPVSRAISSPMS